MKRISTCNVPEDENNLVQTRLGGEFWASDVIMQRPIRSFTLFRLLLLTHLSLFIVLTLPCFLILPSLVPRRSLLPRSRREVWEGVARHGSRSRFDRVENASTYIR